jgi:hypothetical protein
MVDLSAAIVETHRMSSSIEPSDSVLVSIDLGPRPPIARLSWAMSWLTAVAELGERVHDFVAEPVVASEDARTRALRVARGFDPQNRRKALTWVERSQFTNPLIVVIGGAAIAVIFKLLTMFRDWAPTRAMLQAEADMARERVVITRAEGREAESRAIGLAHQQRTRERILEAVAQIVLDALQDPTVPEGRSRVTPIDLDALVSDALLTILAGEPPTEMEVRPESTGPNLLAVDHDTPGLLSRHGSHYPEPATDVEPAGEALRDWEAYNPLRSNTVVSRPTAAETPDAEDAVKRSLERKDRSDRDGDQPPSPASPLDR